MEPAVRTTIFSHIIIYCCAGGKNWEIRPRGTIRGLVGSAPAWDGKGCEFDSWQCRIYIPCSLSLRLLESLRGSLSIYGLTQILCLKKNDFGKTENHSYDTIVHWTNDI